MPTDELSLLSRDLPRAVELLAEACESRSVRYALIGGLATVIHARPRFTQDVDVLIDVPQLVLPGLLDDLERVGFDFDIVTVIRQYVDDHFTVLRFGSARIDWLKPVLPLYARALADATLQPWATGRSVRVATAEGLILTKMAAFRPQDQADIEALIAANRDSLDVSLIRREWSAVADGEDARTQWLESAIARLLPGGN